MNSLRKVILDDLHVYLSLVFLTQDVVRSIEKEAQINFDLQKEGFTVGCAQLKFKLKDLYEDKSFYLDFCGDRIYYLEVNGVIQPMEMVTWVNNQITLPNLRKG